MTVVVIRGPLTPDEIRRIAALMQDIESMRPAETFKMFVDARDDSIPDDVALRMAEAMIPPPLPGYERAHRRWERTPTEADVPDDEVERSYVFVRCEECGYGASAENMVRDDDGAWLCWKCAHG